jgi:hypothetical protein
MEKFADGTNESIDATQIEAIDKPVAESADGETERAEKITGFVKLISGAETITLNPTDGKETLTKARDLFKGWLDFELLKDWGADAPDSATEATSVAVHELIKDGTFEEIFGSLAEDLDTLCLTPAQIIEFVENHKQWLRTGGYATAFLFKASNDFLVFRVYQSRGLLEGRVSRLSWDGVQNNSTHERFVVPQLTPVSSAS